MKNFISNNWKKILVFIGSIFIFLNVFSKITTNTTLLEDYVKYGKDIETPEIIENATEAITSSATSVEAPFGPEMMKFVIILIAAILLVVFLTSLGDRAAKSKKK